MRCAVLGSPITHSLSPALHRAAYAALGLDWSYDAYDVTELTLPGFVAGLNRDWRGLSLTMPLKRAAVPLVDQLDPTATLVGAVNTLLLESDGARRGHNTDVGGMVASLRAAGIDHVVTAAVVGGGATAASALAALDTLGARTVAVLVREPARSALLHPLSQRLGLELVMRPLEDAAGVRADLLLSTVPWDAVDPDRLAAVAPVVFDVVYAPWPTPLALSAQRRGHRVIGGLDLLVNQAALQVELMTGAPAAPLEAMMMAGRQALAARDRADRNGG
jgi:shikimate dehydrogenase